MKDRPYEGYYVLTYGPADTHTESPAEPFYSFIHTFFFLDFFLSEFLVTGLPLCLELYILAASVLASFKDLPFLIKESLIASYCLGTVSPFLISRF